MKNKKIDIFFVTSYIVSVILYVMGIYILVFDVRYLALFPIFSGTVISLIFISIEEEREEKRRKKVITHYSNPIKYAISVKNRREKTNEYNRTVGIFTIELLKEK